MAYPTEPTKNTIFDRVVDVLGDIAEGDNYFYTPGAVQGKATHWKERMADYSVAAIFAGTEEAPRHFGGHRVEEIFTIVVEGAIRDASGETQKALARAIRDIRRAIFADMETGLAGSLGTLCQGCRLGPWVSSPGEGTMEGFGVFNQEFKFTASGDIEDL